MVIDSPTFIDEGKEMETDPECKILVQEGFEFYENASRVRRVADPVKYLDLAPADILTELAQATQDLERDGFEVAYNRKAYDVFGHLLSSRLKDQIIGVYKRKKPVELPANFGEAYRQQFKAGDRVKTKDAPESFLQNVAGTVYRVKHPIIAGNIPAGGFEYFVVWDEYSATGPPFFDDKRRMKPSVCQQGDLIKVE